jgi:hypothetical protein
VGEELSEAINAWRRSTASIPMYPSKCHGSAPAR